MSEQKGPEYFELEQLEPSPVAETPINSIRDSYFPADGPSLRAKSSFLGLQNHSLIWWFTRIQRYSTYPLTAFAVLHVTNTSLIPLATQSVPAADNYLLLTRPYYQSSPLELTLLGIPALLHVSSGLALRVIRRQRVLQRAGVDADNKASVSLKWDSWPPLSVTSALGYLLAPLLAAHLALTRFAPLSVNVPNVDLSYVSHAISRKPLLGYLSLSSLIAVATSHTVLGWSIWLGLGPKVVTARTRGSQEDKRRATSRRQWQITGAVAAAIGTWMFGGLGVVARGGKSIGWTGRSYDKILLKLPFHG